MFARDGADNGKSRPCALRLHFPALNLIERLADLGDFMLGDAAAVILDPQMDLAVPVIRPDRDRRARRGRFDGVIDEFADG